MSMCGACRRAEELFRLERLHFSAWLNWLTTTANHHRNKERYIEVLQAVDLALQSSKVRSPLCACLCIRVIRACCFVEVQCRTG